jgi:hypothetical protein
MPQRCSLLIRLSKAGRMEKGRIDGWKLHPPKPLMGGDRVEPGNISLFVRY